MKHTYTNIGLFILRIGVAVIFIPKGLYTLIDLSGSTEMIAGLAVPAPVVFAILLGLVELIAGIAVLFGAYTRLTATVLGVIVLGAIVLLHGPEGFTTNVQLDISLLALIAGIALIGPGVIRIRFQHRDATDTRETETDAADADGVTDQHE